MKLSLEKVYSGECLCHGVEVAGTVAPAKPYSYMHGGFLDDEPRRRCILIVDVVGSAHDIPYVPEG